MCSVMWLPDFIETHVRKKIIAFTVKTDSNYESKYIAVIDL